MGVEEDSRPKLQDYTAVDNVRDVNSPSKSRIHKNYSTRVTCCKHLE